MHTSLTPFLNILLHSLLERFLYVKSQTSAFLNTFILV